MQSTVEIYFAHNHTGAFTMPLWHGYVSYHCHTFTYVYFTTCPLTHVDKIKAINQFKLVLNHFYSLLWFGMVVVRCFKVWLFVVSISPPQELCLTSSFSKFKRFQRNWIYLLNHYC
jgi:hypothetical protein